MNFVAHVTISSSFLSEAIPILLVPFVIAAQLGYAIAVFPLRAIESMILDPLRIFEHAQACCLIGFAAQLYSFRHIWEGQGAGTWADQIMAFAPIEAWAIVIFTLGVYGLLIAVYGRIEQRSVVVFLSGGLWAFFAFIFAGRPTIAAGFPLALAPFCALTYVILTRRGRVST